MQSVPSRASSKGIRGYSLLELLIAIVIMGVVLSFGARVGFNALLHGNLETEVELLRSQLEAARSMAQRHGQPVRLVFDEQQRRFAIFQFQVPEDISQFPALQSPTASFEGGTMENSRRAEWIASPPRAIPEAFVGRWGYLPGTKGWYVRQPKVTLQINLKDAIQPNDKPAEQAYFWSPRHRHTADSPYSIFPENYHEVPVEHPPALARSVPSDAEKSADGAPLAKLVGQAAVAHFTAATLSQARYASFPGIEFLPSGALAGAWQTPPRLTLSHESLPEVYHTLQIEPSTGEICHLFDKTL
jgi:prepilin-type N-terminal cleavage/methylation domain-containing protein